MKQTSRHSIPARLLAFMLTLMILNPGMILPARAAVPLSAGETVTAIDADGMPQNYELESFPSDGVINASSSAGKAFLVSDAILGATSRIVVAEDVKVTLVLDGVNRTSITSPLEIRAGAEVTLILVDGSENRFTCTGISPTQGIAQAGINVATTATLTILAEEGNPGTLIAKGGRYSAGIGAGPNSGCGAITIAGGVVEAESGGDSAQGSGNGAGIGGGGGHSMGGGHSNGILICGEAKVIATSLGDGAGIGGSGGGKNPASDNTSGGASGGNIMITGNASVTASSKGNGAGIGGGGASTNLSPPNAGAGGDITISGNASVITTTEGNGAGIGGGGSPGAGAAGAGGDITISGNAVVTATSANSAGIGGGGSSGTGTAGAGGSIVISGKPFVTAKTNSVYASAADMGSGISTGGGLGTEGSITITGGNVYAAKMDSVTVSNGYGDELEMMKVTPALAAGGLVTYAVKGTDVDYIYQAIADGDGKTFVWLPLDTSQYTRETQITVVGVKDTAGGGQLYSMTLWSEDVITPYNIDSSSLPLLSPAWVLPSDQLSKLSGIDVTAGEPIEIELIYKSGLADVTIYAKEFDTGDELLSFITPNQVIGQPYSYDSLSIPGYQLVDDTGASKSPFTETKTSVAESGNEITFYYKVASGNQVVIYEDDDTGVEIGREHLTVPVNVLTPAPNPLPTIANYSTTETVESVTWDGLTPLLEITYSYTRDKQPLTLQAYDALTGSQIGTFEQKIEDLRVLENYSYAGDIATLTALLEAAYTGQYTLAPQGSTLWHVDTDSTKNVVKVYYNPMPANAVVVECRIDNQAGHLFHSYTIPAASGQTVALTKAQMPDFSALGFTKDAGSSTLSATAGGTIILVYQDGRFETTISDNLGSSIITEKTPVGETKLLYPPYKSGYMATGYSIDDGDTKQSLAPAFAYEAKAATDIIFYYEPYPQTKGNLTIIVTSAAGTPMEAVTVSASLDDAPLTGIPVTDVAGKVEFSNMAFGAYTITASRSGYQTATASTTLNLLSANQTIKITLVPTGSGGSGGLPDASLTIRCVDEDGAVLYEQSVTAVHGKTEIITAPPLKGYLLAAGEASSQTCRITSGSNVVTFRYVVDEVSLENPRVPTGESGQRPAVSDAVRELLETEEHIRYIQGYPDGTVQPESNISRAEVAVIFWRLIRAADKSSTVPSCFSDVEGDEWFAQAVNYLASTGILTGYEDGTFRPERSISRSEFAAMISRFDGLESATLNPFSDMHESHWAYSYVTSAYLKGWIAGYPDRSFRPEASITRAETIKIVNYMLGRGIQAKDIPEQLRSLYPDLSYNHWAFAEIIEASVEHGYERLDNGYETHING